MALCSVPRCGRVATQQHHHEMPKSLGGDVTMPLCDEHHAWCHDMPTNAFARHRELTRLALRSKCARGERAGTEPYGYRVNGDGRTLHPFEPERQILMVIAECRSAGMSERKTADELTRRGFTTRTGSPWRHQYVRSLLRTICRRAMALRDQEGIVH